MSDEESNFDEGILPDEEEDLEELGMHEEGLGDDEVAPVEEDQ